MATHRDFRDGFVPILVILKLHLDERFDLKHIIFLGFII